MDCEERGIDPPFDDLLCENVEYRTMNEAIHPLDVVALTEDLPERGLVAGQVGTVVEIHEPGVFEVDFCDNDGRTYAMLALREAQIMPLHYSPVAA